MGPVDRDQFVCGYIIGGTGGDAHAIVCKIRGLLECAGVRHGGRYAVDKEKDGERTEVEVCCGGMRGIVIVIVENLKAVQWVRSQGM